MKLKLNFGLTALGAVLLGLAAQAQNPATTGDHGGNGSTQTYPQGAPALRPDSLNNPNSSTNRGDKPNMTRRERREMRRNRSNDQMERGREQNSRMNRSDVNTTSPAQSNGTVQNEAGTPMKSTDPAGTSNANAGNQNGNTGINTMGTSTGGYTGTAGTTDNTSNTGATGNTGTTGNSGTTGTMNTNTGTSTGMGTNANTNAGNQNGNTGINPQGTSTGGYTGNAGTTGNAGNTVNSGTTTNSGNTNNSGSINNNSGSTNNSGNSNNNSSSSGNSGSVNNSGSTNTTNNSGNTGNSGNMNTNTGTSTGMNNTSGTSQMNTGASTSTNTTGTSTAMTGTGTNMRNMSIADFTSAATDYTMLVNALQTTEMTETLRGAGQFTVFAPSNSAFNKLPTRTRTNLLNGKNREPLKQLMSYHVVEGVVDSKELAKRMNAGNGKAQLQTMTGGTLTVQMGTNGRLMLTDDQGGVAYVETPDQFQSNGVIHGVDKVLLPKGITTNFR